MCGADYERDVNLVLQAGSPPRVRSRRLNPCRCWSIDGITSACAEQTFSRCLPSSSWKDHLRVCGADERAFIENTLKPGSPPRVRSRLQGWQCSDRGQRITSACAEQTLGVAAFPGVCWDHLRVCGADALPELEDLLERGSPPRVRSRRACGRSAAVAIGITSACAEQTIPTLQWSTHDRDHLRVCGADGGRGCVHGIPLGSPPRVRSRRVFHRHRDLVVGITSACAEQTRSGVRWSG